MGDTSRILRLRALATELEGRPGSARRDALLHAVRARIVVLEVGADFPGAWPAPNGSSPPRRGSPVPRTAASSPLVAEVRPPLTLDR